MFTSLVFVFPRNVQSSVTMREKRKFLQRCLSYRCEIIRKYLNTAVQRKATATEIVQSTNVDGGIIRVHKIYPDRNLAKRVIS